MEGSNKEEDDEDEDIKDQESSEEDDDDDLDDVEQSAVRWKENLAQKAADAYYERQSNSANLMKLVYGK